MIDPTTPLPWLVGIPGAGGTAYAIYRGAKALLRNTTVASIARALVREYAASDPRHGNGSVRDRIDSMNATLGEVHRTTNTLLTEVLSIRSAHEGLRDDVQKIRETQGGHEHRLATLEDGAPS